MIELVLVLENVKEARGIAEKLLTEKLIVSPFIQESLSFKNDSEVKLTALTRAFLYKEIDDFVKLNYNNVLMYSKPIIDMDFTNAQILLKTTKEA